jgi:DNA invertase Pin-like site-specific DNA recombinase
MSSRKKVSVIQPKVLLTVMEGLENAARKRVAAYARVSTDAEEQQGSYAAQVDYYTRHIQGNPEWEFIGVYADEGISATTTKKRSGFNEMIQHALEGKIDLILTKSISRFARNTVDSLITVRKLKEKRIEVYFEKENIYTLDAKGELLITIMSSLAQEESRSISENVTWGQRKRMADGKVSLPYKQFLGYEKGADGLPRIVESEAKIVRLIYALFLEGKTYQMIARYLTEQEIPTPSGKKRWSVSTISSILRNEKYKGDALLQKKFTVDFLTKEQKVNEGEVPQYYVENSHPAIIEPETFDLVQSEIARRSGIRRQIHNNSPFAAKVYCGQCGGFYGPKVLHSTDKYRYTIWRCNKKYEGGDTCQTPHIREEELQAAFVEAFGQIMGDKDEHIARFEELLPILADTTEFVKKRDTLQIERDALLERMRRCVEENALVASDQDAYNKRYAELKHAYQEAEQRIQKLEREISERSVRKEKICRFLEELRNADNLLTGFDERLWHATVERVTVKNDGHLAFMFRDGTEISVQLPR